MRVDTCRRTTLEVLVRDREANGSTCSESIFNLSFTFAFWIGINSALLI